MSPESQNYLTHALPLTTTLHHLESWRCLSCPVNGTILLTTLGHPFLRNNHWKAGVCFLILPQYRLFIPMRAVLQQYCIGVDGNHSPTCHPHKTHCFTAPNRVVCGLSVSQIFLMMWFLSNTDWCNSLSLSLPHCLHLHFPPEHGKSFLGAESDNNLNNSQILVYLKTESELQDQTKSMYLNSVLKYNGLPLLPIRYFKTKESKGQSLFSPWAPISLNTLNLHVPSKDYCDNCSPPSA